MFLRTLLPFKLHSRVIGQVLRLRLGAKIEDVLLDNVILVFKFLLDSIDLALYGLDRTMGKLEV